MPLTELKNLIRKYRKDKDSAPIRLPTHDSRCYAVNNIINSSSERISAFIFFNDNQESELYDCFISDYTQDSLKSFLDESDGIITFLTNNSRKVKSSNFISDFSSKYKKRVKVVSLSEGLSKHLSDNLVDNEFLLSAPDDVVFFGKYTPDTKKKLTSLNAFVNLYDGEFYDMFYRFFDRNLSKAISGDLS